MPSLWKKFFWPLLRTLQKGRDLSSSQQWPQNFFSAVFGIFTIKWTHSRGTFIQNNFFIKNRPTLLYSIVSIVNGLRKVGNGASAWKMDLEFLKNHFYYSKGHRKKPLPAHFWYLEKVKIWRWLLPTSYWIIFMERKRSWQTALQIVDTSMPVFLEVWLY
jgi:hypothetical protein